MKPTTCLLLYTPSAAISSSPSSSGETVFALGSGTVRITDYLDGDESSPANYTADINVTGGVLMADLSPLQLDLDNLNSLLSGAGKSPASVFRSAGFHWNKSDSMAGATLISTLLKVRLRERDR